MSFNIGKPIYLCKHKSLYTNRFRCTGIRTDTATREQVMTPRRFPRSARWSTLCALVIALLIVGVIPVHAGPPGGRISVNGRKGFDKCWALGTGQMDDVANQGPYWVVGVYIGGINVGSCNNNVTYNWVSHNGGVGWGFLPIYVGRFAPCYNSQNHYKMSSDINTAKTQAYNAAKDAESAVNALGFTQGTEIYLDMEAYDTSNTSCRNAVNAYVNEWARTLKADGYRAGAYGSSCGSAVNDWAYNATPPDDVWIAQWNGNTDVYAVSCVNSGFWVYDQRHHQYTLNTPFPVSGEPNAVVNEDCSQGHVAGNGYDDGVPNDCP